VNNVVGFSPVNEPKQIAVWDYQVEGLHPNAAARAWMTSSDINLGDEASYIYRLEIWIDQYGEYKGVAFCYARHPITGRRYVNYRSKKRSFAALNSKPVVLDLYKLPPQEAIDNFPDPA
jgi:hypothetical protein